MATQSAVDPTQNDAAQHARTNTERIAAIEAVLPFLATKADIASLKTELENHRSDLTWRIIIAMGVLTAIFTAVITLSTR